MSTAAIAAILADLSHMFAGAFGAYFGCWLWARYGRESRLRLARMQSESHDRLLEMIKTLWVEQTRMQTELEALRRGPP